MHLSTFPVNEVHPFSDNYAVPYCLSDCFVTSIVSEMYQKLTEKSVVFLKTIEKQSVKCTFDIRFGGLRLFQFQTFKQPAALLFYQKLCFGFVPWLPETAVVHSFVKK